MIDTYRSVADLDRMEARAVRATTPPADWDRPSRRDLAADEADERREARQ